MTSDCLIQNLELKKQGIICQQYQPWLDAGLMHGFLGKLPSEFSFQYFGTEQDHPFLVKQTHSDKILDLREDTARKNLFENPEIISAVEADALVLNSISNNATPLIFAIRTADCLPVFIKSKNQIALVHAGWQGLANKIIVKTLNEFFIGSEQDNEIEVLIGPCAGKNNYEVGEEVLEAIGTFAVAVPMANKSHNKYLLDLAGTAKRQITSIVKPGVIVTSDTCTISDLKFNSYRRNGKQAGRNLSFTII